MTPNILILLSTNRNFPLNLEPILRENGYLPFSISSFADFVTTPARAQPFLAIFEIGNSEDLQTASLAHEWAERVQPFAVARYLLIFGSRNLQNSSRALRLMKSEIASLPQPGRNLLFKIELQLKLLSTEKAEVEPNQEGFTSHFEEEAGGHRRVLVMKGPGPKEGSWKAVDFTPQGKVRWRWVKLPPKEKPPEPEIAFSWIAESTEAPFYDDKSQSWRSSDDGADVSSYLESTRIFSARELANRISTSETVAGGKFSSLQEKKPGDGPAAATVQIFAADAPLPAPGQQKLSGEAALERKAAGEKTSVAVKRAGEKHKDLPVREAAPRPEKKTKAPGAEAGPESAAAKAEKKAALTAEPGKKLGFHDEVAAGALPAEKTATQSGAAEDFAPRDLRMQRIAYPELAPAAAEEVQLAEIEEKKKKRTEAAEEEGVKKRKGHPGFPTDTGTTAKKENSISLAPTPDRELRTPSESAAEVASLSEPKRTVNLEDSQQMGPSGTNNLLTEEGNSFPSQLPESQRQAMPSDAAIPTEKSYSISNVPPTAEWTPHMDTPSSPQKTAAPFPAEAAAKANLAAAKPLEPKPPTEAAAASAEDPEITRLRKLLEETAVKLEKITVGDSGLRAKVPGFLGMSIYEHVKVADQRAHLAANSAQENPEEEGRSIRTRHFVTLTLKELGDQDSSWQPVQRYRIYLAANHRYFGLPQPEAVLPLWIYEGELAPEFLDGKEAWKFYDRPPVALASLASLPQEIIDYLNIMAKGSATPRAAHAPASAVPVAMPASPALAQLHDPKLAPLPGFPEFSTSSLPGGSTQAGSPEEKASWLSTVVRRIALSFGKK